METINFNEVVQAIQTDKLKYYNFYNVDVNIPQHYAVKYYIENPEDNLDIPQKVSTLFVDIEVYTYSKGFEDNEISGGFYPISAISCYDSITNDYNCFFLLINHKKELFDDIEQFVKTFNDKYFTKNDKVNFHFFEDELELITSFWEYVHKVDPIILSGFNSDNFDYPYIYNRLRKLCKSEKIVGNIISQFGSAKLNHNSVEISEYTISDILYLFKPRDEGGLNYGDKLNQYSLNNISSQFLGLTKIEHDESLDKLYDNDPKKYLYYNLVDVLLVKKLNDRFNHINLHNIIRRIANCPYHLSIRGISLTYDTFILYQLTKQNKFVRFAISTEKDRNITKSDLADIPRIKTSKGNTEPVEVSAEDFRKLTTKYSGAYVKTSHATIINDGSLIIDLDASSLYPSMILQHNISFDVFKGIIINPPLYKLLELFDSLCGKETKMPQQLPENIYKYVVAHVDKESYLNKSSAISGLYYVSLFLIDQILKSNIPFSKICNPSNDAEIFILKFYLLPLLDILNNIHPLTTTEYNQFIYDYLFDSSKKYTEIYVINNPFETNCNISKLKNDDIVKYLNKYNSTIAGTTFEKHESKIGIFTGIINKLRTMRSDYKKKRDSYQEGEEKYILFDNTQFSVKGATNSIYGIYGLSSFRYSSHWLAQSITSQGRLTNKIAQYIAEMSLKTI